MTSNNYPRPDISISRWDTEGGAGPDGPQVETISKHEEASTRQHPSGELDQLRARVIGLENLIIALLADATEVQLDRVRDMSLHISPRQGSVPHPLTTDAAAHMMSMVARARHFRT